MTKQRQIERAKRHFTGKKKSRVRTENIKSMTPMLATIYGKETAEWVEKARISIKEDALKLREEGKLFLGEAVIDVFNREITQVALPKAKCKSIKANGVRQISAIFYDHQKDVDFVGTMAQREDGSFSAFTMELPEMGKYELEPLIYPDIDTLVWEQEHWIAGLIDYVKEKGIKLEWKAFCAAWRRWDKQSLQLKASRYNVQINLPTPEPTA